MATIEKLIKAFEGLKVFQSGTSVLEDARKKDTTMPSKKDKILHCNIVADCICAPNMRTISDFPKFLGIAMETFLTLTDDAESDVRMVADECINRTIKILLETNLGRLQVELYKELKKNGASRSLRAALWRFADMCHLIRPQKCRPYIVNLLPCIARICRREEEAVQDTLAAAMPKICTALMPFANDTEVKALLKSFLPNLKSSSAVCRRMSASSLALICQHSRAPMSFFNYLINVLLEMLLPVDIDHEVSTLLGVLLCLRHSIPSLASSDSKDQGLKDSFGFRESEAEQGIGEEQVIKIIQTLLHYSGHRDHNVVTASLEALQQLLRTPPPDLLRLLLTQGALSKSFIFAADALEDDQARIESAVDLTSMSDDTGLDEDMDLVVKTAGGPTSTSSQSDSSAFVSDYDANSLEDQKSEDATRRKSVDFALEDDKNNIIVTDGTEYSGVEIAEISEERSEVSATSAISAGISHSDSIETLQSVRSLSPFPGQAQLPGHDMNGNPQLPVTEVEDVIPPPSPNPSLNEPLEQVMPDSLKEDEVPLLFYLRLICKRFLLTGVTEGLVPDKVVRVSLKSLALSCVSSCLAICPRLFLFKLCPTASGAGNDQNIQDITLYAFHHDHQLKGQTALVIGQFLTSALSEGRSNFNQWVMEHLPSKQNVMSLEDLLKTIIHILKDESAVATKAALVALQSCLPPLLESSHGRQGLRILIDLLKVKDNPYWLVKVELLELLAGLNFKSIHYLESVSPDIARGDHCFLGKLCIQEHYLKQIILPMLADEDGRVRVAASNSILRLVPKLYYASDSPQQDPVLAVAADETERLLSPIMHPVMGELPPLVHGLVKPYSFDILTEIAVSTESALSRVIQLLLQRLQTPQSRYMTNGVCHALCKLSEEYLVTQYACSWNCGPVKPVMIKDREEKDGMRRPPSRSLSQSSMDELTSASGGGPVPIIMTLMLASPAGLELTTLQDLMQLAGNLISGLVYKNLRPSEETDQLTGAGDDSPWPAISDRLLVPIVELLFTHTIRLLNACTHAIEETTPGPPQVKPSLPSLPNASTLSPVRRKVKGDKDSNSPQASPAADNKASPKTGIKDSKEPEKDKNKKDGLGSFYNLPHMMKLFEVLRGSYSNFKTSLDLSSSDKFCTILRTTLTVLSQLLEVATLHDIGKVTEELLGYLKVVMALEPTWTVLTVQQLLKALFGTNLASQWDPNCQSTAAFTTDLAVRVTAGSSPGLYYHCLNKPYSQLAHCLVGAACKATLPADEAHGSLVWLKQRVDRKIPAILKPSRNVDTSVIGWYIRLFEPLVIKALKQYTVSSSLELQSQVLALIAQLIQLRVNYCLLDSDQIFIGFVLKQFEYIEEGQIRNSELLIPYIFHFLVMLSYEKFHSKSIIDMPRIIHRCDGIMASGLMPTTHAIPALKPVVYDLFLMRGTVKSEVSKDLETQREVVVSMLLRLVQYHQALDMFVLVLQQCHRESEERWKRLSRQVIDIVLPALTKHQINLNSQESLDVLHRLFESVAPIVFRPVDLLLKTLLAPPHDVGDLPNLQKWLCLVLTVVRVLVSQSKEEVILSRLQELQLHVTLIRDQNAPDQMTSSNSVMELLRNLAPEETLAWFLLQVIGKCSELLDKETTVIANINSDGKSKRYDFLLQQTLHLLLYVTHMFQSGLFRKVATAAMRLLQLESPACMYSVRQINEHMMGVSSVCPMLALHWCNVLILLNFDDRSLWSQIVQTPPSFKIVGKERGHSQSTEENESVGCHSQRLSQSCGMEMLRRGGLILFCDYVCENLSDAEHMTWLIINHVGELVLLSQESPVQDFIGAIQRNPAASSLFVQAIHARGDSISKPSMVKKTLKCLEGIHTSQSGALIALMIDKFLSSHQLAVTRMTDSITCQRLETLLGENSEERNKQLPKEDIEKLLHFMKSNGLIQRHQRLASLLSKLCAAAGSTMQMKLSPERSHPLAVEPVDVSNLTIDKDFFMSVVKEQCFKRNPNCRECAFLLQRLDYPDILSITMTKEFSLSILEECMSLGAFRTVLRYNRDTESGNMYSPSSQSGELTVDPLFQASHLTMFMHISNIVSQLPAPHQCLVFTACAPASSLHYLDHFEELITEPHWSETNFALAAALVRYLRALQSFPWKGNQMPSEYQKEVARFAVLLAETVHWSMHHDNLPQSGHLQTCLACLALLVQNQEMHHLLGLVENASWVCTVIASLYQLLASMAVSPGEQMAPVFHDDHKDEVEEEDDVSLYSNLMKACDQMSEMVHCLQTRLDPNNWDEPRLPLFLAPSFRNIIIGLSRLPVVNSYARTPPLVWRLGWSPTPVGELHTTLPPLPVEYLQEKDVLKEFVTRINFLGWVNRQQFEESWMSLLGVLNPVSHLGMQLSPEEEMEQAQGMVIAVKAITSLLLHSSLVPVSGNPTNGTYEIRPRDKPLAFLHTRCGKKLFVIRGLIEQEITSLCSAKSDHMSSLGQGSSVSDRFSQGLFEGNLERELGFEEYSLGQISIESTWSLIGLLDMNLEESDTTDSIESTGGQKANPNQPASSPTSLSNSSSHSGATRSVAQSGLDVHSCLQFLLELYGAWLHVENSPKPPLMLLNSVVKSMVCLSDLFMERDQYEFMQDILLDLLKAHPVEDELLTQYMVVGFCKATAVMGTEPAISERVVKLVENGLKSTHLPTKIAALFGCLYLFEGGVTDLNCSLLPIITEFLSKHLAIVSQACIISQQFVITMWATAFYIIENFSSEIKDTDFASKIMQLVVHTASSSEENISSAVFLVVLKGTERLLLTDVLPQSDRETIIKLSMDRLCLPNPQRALAALGLMFTCMYSGKSLDQYSPRPREEQTFGEPGFELLHQDPDSLILAMERVTVLFDRIKKGYPYEARVITRLLPAFLADFFPAQDIMNKVIGEFLSAHQPYPHLIAKVVFQVFTNLHQQQQQGLVKEWVMLSLSNFTQRSPLAMAVWSLTLFFISASTNVWLRALFPHVLGRMGRMDVVDRQLFCLSALDFYHQLTDDAHKRAFVATFHGIATADSPYGDLIRSIA